MVCSVKYCLIKCIGGMNHNELNTLLIEVKSVLNSRPLIYFFDDSEGVSYTLSPSHLIHVFMDKELLIFLLMLEDIQH